jgi:hypothetical protein
VALAVTVGIAAAAYRVVDFSNGYWIAMTILIVLRSELRDTVRITVTRITGTMAGAGVATNHRLFSAAVANHLGGADRRDGVGVLCVIARQLCSVQHVDHRVHRPAVCLWGSAGSRPWHCIGSLPPRSAAVSRLPHIFFTSPVLRAVAPPSAHRHLALEPVLLGARRPGARETFERLRRNKAVP